MDRKNMKLDLTKRREDLNLSQLDLAELCKTSRGTIERLEKRTANPTVSVLKSYAKILDINPLDIIDTEHEFNHYTDNEQFKLHNIASIEEIKNLCIRLETKRVNDVYNYSHVQLIEQKDFKITYNALKNKAKEHNLRIIGEIYDDNHVIMLEDIDRYFEKFYGTAPLEYSGCIKIKTNDIKETFLKDQIIFLRKASAESLYSGVIVICEKDGQKYLRIFRSVHNRLYMVPLNSKTADKNDEDLNYKDNKYLWHENDDWKILYSINQSTY